MYVTRFFWHDASKELPYKTCDVIAASENSDGIYDIQRVTFSARHRKFNCEDYYSEESADCLGFDDVKYWMYFDEFANTLKTIEKINSK